MKIIATSVTVQLVEISGLITAILSVGVFLGVGAEVVVIVCEVIGGLVEGVVYGRFCQAIDDASHCHYLTLETADLSIEVGYFLVVVTFDVMSSVFWLGMFAGFPRFAGVRT